MSIKPCPFCGGHVQLVIDYEPGQGRGWPYAQVVCEERSCQARSRKFLQNWGPGMDVDYTVMAMRAWNRRVGDAP